METKRDRDETETETKSRWPNGNENGNQLLSTTDRPVTTKMVDEFDRDGDGSSCDGVRLGSSCESLGFKDFLFLFFAIYIFYLK